MDKKTLLFEIDMIDAKVLDEGLVDEKKKDSTYIRAEVKFSHADKLNNNKRLYSKDLMLREIDRMKPLCTDGAVTAGAYHPQSGLLEVPEVAALWENIWMEDDGACVGIVKILPTPHGLAAQTLIKAGGKIGMSTRGFGTVTRKTNRIEGERVEYDEVNEDYKMISPGDIVLTPSVPDAGVRKLIEQRANEAFGFDKNLLSEEENVEKKQEFKTIESLEDLKKEFPELIVKIREEAVAEAKKAAEKEEKDKKSIEEQKKEWQEEIRKEFQPKIDELEKARTETVEAIREAATTLTDIPGVIPEGEKKDSIESSASQPNEELQKEINELKNKIAESEKREKDAEEAAKKAKEDTDNKAKIVTALEAELSKEENEKYAEFIKKDFEAGKLTIEDEEKIPEAVKNAKENYSNLAVELQRKEILKDNKEKGLIINPDDANKKELTEEQILKLYDNAGKSGWEGTLEDYKSKVLKK